jgi:hypothetical protein
MRVFVKARHKYSYGSGEWEYHEINTLHFGGETDEKAIENWNELVFCDQHADEQHHRGTEIQQISKPPGPWLEKEIIRAKHMIERLSKKVERYERLANEV